MTRRATARYGIEADDSQARRALDRTKRGFQDLAVVARRVGGVFAVVSGATGLASMTQEVIKQADEISKLSRQYGLSTEFLSQMRGVLELTGGDFDQLTKGTRTLSQRLLDLDRELASAVDNFDDLGLSAEDFVGLGTEERLLRVVTALGQMRASTERTAVAQNIFGRSSETFLRLADAGADSVRALREEQDRLGRTITQDQGEDAERFADAMARLEQALTGIVQTGALSYVEDLANAVEAANAGLQGIRGQLPSRREDVGATDFGAIFSELFRFGVLGAAFGGSPTESPLGRFTGRIGGQGVQTGPAFSNAFTVPSSVVDDGEVKVVLEQIELNTRSGAPGTFQ